MAALTLRVRTGSGQHVLNQLSTVNTVLDLKKHLSDLSKIPVEDLIVLSGFPPKQIDFPSTSATIGETKIKSGDTLILEKREKPPVAPDPVPDSIFGSPLLRKIVPADNSCLFTSIGFILNGKVDPTLSSHMRELIAQQVSDDPDTYSEAILGKENKTYCYWIKKSESWGGAIEISILANFYGIELVVLDTVSACINRFGEDKNFDLRGFLMFDGIHYDPVYRETGEGEQSVQTLFPTEDFSFLQQAQELAKEAQSSKQFTDVNRFTLRCLVCRQELTGQVEAQQHAAKTGHANFGEIAS